jgi:hypothetical protein
MGCRLCGNVPRIGLAWGYCSCVGYSPCVDSSNDSLAPRTHVDVLDEDMLSFVVSNSIEGC